MVKNPYREKYLEGKADRRNGKPIFACPYTVKRDSYAWQLGWKNEDKALRFGASPVNP